METAYGSNCMRVTKYVLMFPVSGVMWRNFKIMFIKSLQLQRKCIWYMYGKVQETQIFRQIDNCLSTERIDPRGPWFQVKKATKRLWYPGWKPALPWDLLWHQGESRKGELNQGPHRCRDAQWVRDWVVKNPLSFNLCLMWKSRS